jgi:asparagine synthase (glutamine-hydrolysing)
MTGLQWGFNRMPEPFDQRLIIGLGSLDDGCLQEKREVYTENCYGDRLPKEILKFKKVGLSAPWEII